MRILIAGAIATLLTTAAYTQMISGNPPPPPPTPGAAASGNGIPAPGSMPAPNSVTGAEAAANRVGDYAARTKDGAATAAADNAAAAAKLVRVEAGGSIRVPKGVRCYQGGYYFDPTLQDGAYYCEDPHSSIAANVRTAVPRETQMPVIMPALRSPTPQPSPGGPPAPGTSANPG